MTANVNTPTLVESPYVANGGQLNVPSTAVAVGSAIPVHVVDAPLNAWHVFSMECTNLDTVDRVLTITWGGDATKDKSEHTIPPHETVVVADRRRIRAMTVKVFEASGSGLLNVFPQADVLANQP